jgi:hypothetical protein
MLRADVKDESLCECRPAFKRLFKVYRGLALVIDLVDLVDNVEVLLNCFVIFLALEALSR